MRILVKNLRSRRFLTIGGEWTADEKQARTFDTIVAASVYCRSHDQGVAVVFRFGDLRSDLAFKE